MTNAKRLLSLVIIISLQMFPPLVFASQYHVAPSGNDKNPGTEANPFRTITRAAEMLKVGDVCCIHAGVYRETINIKRPGTAEKPIRIVAEAGESVTISGTELIRAKWAIHKGNIYKTRTDTAPEQLFANGTMMVEARWPNQPFAKRWDKETWRPSAEGSDYGKMVDPALAKIDIDWTGAMAVLNVGSWQTFLRPVLKHEKGSATFQYARDLGRRHESESTQAKRRKVGFDNYFLYGKLEALDSPGEWFFDRETRTLYLYPPDGKSPENMNIEGKVRNYGLRITRKDHIQIDGLRFFASTFLIDYSDNCIVENCTLDFPTYVGPAKQTDDTFPPLPKRVEHPAKMLLGGFRTLAPTLIEGNHNTVRNCTIRFSEGPGLLIAGSENTVENCLIHDIDWRGLGNGAVSNCAAVYMAASERSTFRRNTIYNIGSSEGIVLPSRGPSLCELNYVHHGGLIQSDGGLIQCNGIRLNGTIIRNNWTHDHHAFNWGAIGIRGDDLTRDLIIHNNVVWNCDEKAIMIKGDRNQAYNNTCFDNATLDLVLWAAPEPHKEWAGPQWEHLLKAQNANSKAFNNYAPVITGQMHHEVRRAKKIIPPLAELANNISAEHFSLTDPKKLLFDKKAAADIFESPNHKDFRPCAASPLIDAGRAIPGITKDISGKAPDIGAYERGDANYWIPGHQGKQASRPIPPDAAKETRKSPMLAWLAGYQTDSSDLYIGTNRKRVENANHQSPEFRGNQTNNMYIMDVPLGPATFWRVDSIKEKEIIKGEVWHFLSPNKK